MNQQEAKELLPIITAFAEGRIVQMQNRDSTWSDMSNPEFGNHPERYRIKPEPKLRPFTQAEAARFRLFRLKDDVQRGWMATCVFFPDNALIDTSIPTYDELAQKFECSVDGQTWQKCGVEE